MIRFKAQPLVKDLIWRHLSPPMMPYMPTHGCAHLDVLLAWAILPARVPLHIPVNTRPIDQPQRVCFDIPPRRRIVVPHPVPVQAIVPSTIET